MTYYPRRGNDEVKEIYTMVSGRHVRRTGPRAGDRVTLVAGDTCHPTKKELKAFRDKFRIVQAPATVDDDEDVEETQSEPEEKQETAPTTSDPTPQSTTTQTIGTGGANEPEFSSTQAYDLWVELGKPSLENVEMTGYNGTKYSKKDIQSLQK